MIGKLSPSTRPSCVRTRVCAKTYLKLSTVLKLILLWKTRVENSKNLSRKHPSEKTQVPNQSKKSEPIELKNLNTKFP